MTSEQILIAEFEQIKEEIIARHDELGMRASGDFANSLEVEGKGLTVKLFGFDYVEYLVDGRGPGNFPPISAIEQWIDDKGLSAVEADISVSSLAFLIARKIANEGTEYFKQGGTDLLDSVITPQRIQSIIDKVSVFRVAEFTSRFTNLFQELAA